jgi:hypothetical protein
VDLEIALAESEEEKGNLQLRILELEETAANEVPNFLVFLIRSRIRIRKICCSSQANKKQQFNYPKYDPYTTGLILLRIVQLIKLNNVSVQIILL